MSGDEPEPGAEGGAPSSPQPRPTRREFLRAGGAAAAGAVVGGAVGAAIGVAAGRGGVPEAGPGRPSAAPGGPLDHLVVLMCENRSFDNLLGWLYTPESPPPDGRFEGLAFGSHANRAADGTSIPAHVYRGATDRIMELPDPDPGEEYPHVNTQLFGTVDPPGNAGREVGDMTAPFNAPRDARHPDMSGFVRDYTDTLRGRAVGATEPDAERAAQIMGGFDPTMLPVLSTLAREFAVFDCWHCAVPSQTFCNRSFFHASTSHGFVTNVEGGGAGKWLAAPAATTVFERLEAAGLSWRIYYDEQQLISITGFVHAPALERFWRTGHFATMARFEQDAADGALPAYAFIEPRMVYDHNDFHPPVGRLRESEFDGEAVIDSAVSDVRAGEALVERVYRAVRTAASPTGSNARNTMLLITFDEHGGTYDHVPPPSAVPPDDAGPGEMGFAFDRLGVRVPAIAVSAYTAAGTVIHDEFHHAAVIATLCRRHGLEPLTRRDADERVRDLTAALTLAEPRDPASWPSPTPQYVPPNPESDPPHPGTTTPDRPLSPPARGLLGLLLAKYGRPGEARPETYGDAYRLLQEHGRGLFGEAAR